MLASPTPLQLCLALLLLKVSVYTILIYNRCQVVRNTVVGECSSYEVYGEYADYWLNILHSLSDPQVNNDLYVD